MTERRSFLASVPVLMGLSACEFKAHVNSQPSMSEHARFIITEELFFQHLAKMVDYPYYYDASVNEKGWILVQDPRPMRGTYVVHDQEDKEPKVVLLNRRPGEATVKMSPIGAVYYFVTGTDYEPWEPSNPNVDWELGYEMGMSRAFIDEIALPSATDEASPMRTRLLQALGLPEAP